MKLKDNSGWVGSIAVHIILGLILLALIPPVDARNLLSGHASNIDNNSHHRSSLPTPALLNLPLTGVGAQL